MKISSLNILDIVSCPIPPFYHVLFAEQNNPDARGIAIARWNGIGWDICSYPGQPKIVQWYNAITGRFVDCEIEAPPPREIS